MKLGVFGGTFDPVHAGHLIVAEEARERLGLDRVLFVPAGQPWFKTEQPVRAAHHRMAMVEAAVADNPFFEVSDMEMTREGPSYSVDTLAELRGRPGNGPELYVLLGVDVLEEIDRWHEPARVFELAKVVGLSRPGSQSFAVGTLEAIKAGASREVILMEGPLIGISGTDIRERVSLGRSIKYRVPGAVEAYIFKHGIYRSPARSASETSG